jgi:hypothetical protein
MDTIFMVVLFFVGIFVGMLTLSLVAINRENHEAAAAKEETARVTRQYQALILADDFYSEMTHRKNRLHQLQFEMQYCDNDFTEQWSAEERKEIAEVCGEMLEQERKDYLENLEAETGGNRQETGKARWEPKIALDDVINEEPVHAL